MEDVSAVFRGCEDVVLFVSVGLWKTTRGLDSESDVIVMYKSSISYKTNIFDSKLSAS